MMHVCESAVDSSGPGTVSMDGTAMAMIANCAAISATNSVTRTASRILLRP